MIAERQAERKRTERAPVDWGTYRKALIESGMVEEARARREREVGELEAFGGALRGPAIVCSDPANCGCRR
jgi:hypothetical protein